jgi:HTH-type transcriptional regulator/antitoxin HigA
MATKTKSTGGADPRRRGQGQTAVPAGADRAYLALIHRFPLRPLRSDAELDAAAAIIDELTDRDDLSESESDYLDVLGSLVEDYEDEHVEMPHVSDGAMLRNLMDEKGVRQAEVVRGTGINKTILSLVLNEKRNLTREHIEALARYFKVSPAVFLGSE